MRQETAGFFLENAFYLFFLSYNNKKVKVFLSNNLPFFAAATNEVRIGFPSGWLIVQRTKNEIFFTRFFLCVFTDSK